MSWRLLSWNVNGLRAAEKKGFVSWLGGAKADVVAVQEIKAQPDQLSEALLQPPGYHAVFHAAEKKGYSGVATYSARPPAKVSTGLNDPRFDADGRVLLTEFEPFTLFNIYFPNGGRGPDWVAHKLAFYRRFLEIAEGYLRSGRAMVVTGDFNTAFAEIDIARPRENQKTSGFMPEERASLGEYFAAGMVDTFRHLHPDTIKYTWWDMVSRARLRNVGWRLDYFLVSPSLKDRIMAAEVLDEIQGSDHCPISLELDV